MKVLLSALAALAASVSVIRAQPAANDPFQWLEEVESPRAMAWVEAQNARTAARLEKDWRYEPFRKAAAGIFTASDRVAAPHFRAGGIDSFWQDATHVHGVWRHASRDSFRARTTQWRTVLDLDALSRAEGRNWIWKGAECLKPAETLCLVSLSDGGGDAVEVREFDTVSGRFVEGGFRFAAGKQNLLWVDPDTLVAAREWTPGQVTASGYPYVVKRLTRGGGPAEVFRGLASDVAVEPEVLRGQGGRPDALMVRRGLTYFETEYSLLSDKGPVRVPLPLQSDFEAYVDGQAVFALKVAWKGFAAGALISFDLEDLKRDPATAKPQLLFQPGPREAVQTVSATQDRVVVVLLDNVLGAVDVYDHKAGVWLGRRLGLPVGANIVLSDASATDNQLFLGVESFLTPAALWLADAGEGTAVAIKAGPRRFDPSTHVAEQRFATSSDGAKIPYFLVRPKAMKADGRTPTIMYGYGGFEISKPPVYLPEMGKLWLERGGAYVIANIRGGGEFGPAWHQAALRDKRQLAFDDFAAVARDLIARKVTSPRRLGIYGRSNGGVLTSVSMTQHPELWNAVVIESPLIDMLRYSHLSAGASWIGEYGDPDLPADRAFISAYSAYQNLKPGVKYPEPYITTNIRDDRVHPGHARKFAARLEAMGVPYLYYEQTFGGHANDADPELNARRWARHYVYLAQKLMD